MMRLFADNFLSPASSIASPGLDELRWLQPVRPGDMLSLRVTILEARRSRSRPDQGVVRSLVEVLNQHGEVVMSIKPISLIRCGPADLERRHLPACRLEAGGPEESGLG